MAQARGVFADYQARGVILNESFDDSTWKTSNETINATLALLSFENNSGVFQEWLGIPEVEYAAYVKAYIALKFGDYALLTLQVLTKTLASLPYMLVDEAAALTKNAAHIAEFLSLLPGSTAERDWIEETLEERVQKYRHNSGADRRRVLAAFDSYLQFDEILRDYWQTLGDDAKLFYFPVYLWWNLTAILPLRPTEFLLTPRDCINGNAITVRRTRLKGGGKVSYRIAHDYELRQYEITPALADEIRMYISMTEHTQPAQIDALFRLEPHYGYIGRGIDRLNRYYTYHNMRACLDTFFAEAVEPDGHDIGRIKLGDTRHLAMVNLIISGGSPVICRELAGHADVAVSSHYYTNISNLVENLTIKRLRKSKGSDVEFAGEARYPLKRPDDMLRLAEGWCDAESVKAGNVGECLKVVDGRGRIGECASCGHYWSDAPGIRARFFDESAGRQRVPDAYDRTRPQRFGLRGRHNGSATAFAG